MKNRCSCRAGGAQSQAQQVRALFACGFAGANIDAESEPLITRGEFRRRYPERQGLIINVPPRTAKSILTSVCWPCWSWMARPGMRFLCASYSDQLATEHSLARRNLITSRWYQLRWGDRFM